MSRDELLDDEIVRAKDAGNLQLADWLRTARGSNEASRWYAEKLRDLRHENAKLRELILDMLVDEERGHNDDSTYYEHVRLAKKLGIEVDR